MKHIANDNELVISSYALTAGLRRRLHTRVPRHGDKSKLIRTLIQKFLDGEVEVIIAEKPRTL